MSEELKKTILAHEGVIPEELIKKPTSIQCPKCSQINAVENKFCTACSCPITQEGLLELKEQEQKKYNDLEARFEIQEVEFNKKIESLKNHLFETIDKIPVYKFDDNNIAEEYYRYVKEVKGQQVFEDDDTLGECLGAKLERDIAHAYRIRKAFEKKMKEQQQEEKRTSQ